MGKRTNNILRSGTNMSKGIKTMVMIIITVCARHCAKHSFYIITLYFASSGKISFPFYKYETEIQKS